MASKKSTLSSCWMACNQNFVFPRDASSEETLRKHWDRTTAGWNSDAANAWFDKISTMHSESGRYYHTLVHLEEMLGYLELLPPQHPVKEHSYKSLVLTVFFHDAVYDPKSSTNEEDSASLFQDFMRDVQGNDDGALKSQVVSIILATKQHETSDIESDEQLLLDIDMAVLGKEKDAYMAYAALIRCEYAFVDHDMYCEKRAQVLEGFLKSPRIYGTKLMRETLEDQARANLRSEIEVLRQGCIPGGES